MFSINQALSKKSVSPKHFTGGSSAAALALSLIAALPAMGSAAGAPGAAKLSPLAADPAWSRLEQYQETITREEFTRLLEEVYAPGGAARSFVGLSPAAAAIVRRSADPALKFELRFAPDAAAIKPMKQPWKSSRDLAPDRTQPLAGLKIALDPGHIGGRWAKIEERWFAVEKGKPVIEGEMTLQVAKLIAPKLREQGATVSLVRRELQPVTSKRPGDFWFSALKELRRQLVRPIRDSYSGPDDSLKEHSIRWHAERLFYRVSEIRTRAKLVNEKLRPDLTVCLHFNAEAWGGPAEPKFVPANHLHLLVNGCYSAAELEFDDVRFEMFNKLLSRSLADEVAISQIVGAHLARATGLPPYEYTTGNAIRLGESHYVWGRNLLANRLYHSPTIYLEPYVMNNQTVYERVQLGDYEGERVVGGVSRGSIYREYADAVVSGLIEHYTATTHPL